MAWQLEQKQHKPCRLSISYLKVVCEGRGPLAASQMAGMLRTYADTHPQTVQAVKVQAHWQTYRPEASPA